MSLGPPFEAESVLTVTTTPTRTRRLGVAVTGAEECGDAAPSGPNSVPTATDARPSRSAPDGTYLHERRRRRRTGQCSTREHRDRIVRPITRLWTPRRVETTHARGQVLLRKEVIQPHLPVRLPCYDFVLIADPTFDSSLPEGLGHWLRVLPTFMT